MFYMIMCLRPMVYSSGRRTLISRLLFASLLRRFEDWHLFKRKYSFYTAKYPCISSIWRYRYSVLSRISNSMWRLHGKEITALTIPSQLQTAGSVTYETLPNTVLDIHSHVGGVPAHFSNIDDRDEQGLGLYAVVGDLRNLCPTIELRLGIYGYFMPLKKEDIFV